MTEFFEYRGVSNNPFELFCETRNGHRLRMTRSYGALF